MSIMYITDCDLCLVAGHQDTALHRGGDCGDTKDMGRIRKGKKGSKKGGEGGRDRELGWGMGDLEGE